MDHKLFTISRQDAFAPFHYDVANVADRLAHKPRFMGIPTPFYSIAQHAVIVSLYQEIVGAALSVQYWGLHHEDAYAYDPINLNACEYTQRFLALNIPLSPAWPPPASMFLHNAVVTATEALAFGLDLDPEHFKAITPDERLTIIPLPAHRARNLYLDRHHELLAAMEAQIHA